MAQMRTDELLIPQGTTWEVRWPVVDAAGVPADLTGWQVRAQVRPSRRVEEVLHEWLPGDGTAVILDSAVVLRVAPEVSTQWEWASGVYDVEIFHTDGRVIRITQGLIRVDSEVTR